MRFRGSATVGGHGVPTLRAGGQIGILKCAATFEPSPAPSPGLWSPHRNQNVNGIPAWDSDPAIPFDDPEAFRQRSPITYVKNIKTPTMFVLGDADSRTPAESGGDQMFRALTFRNIPTAMVRFPGESHDLSRSGTPWHRVERLQHIVNWFDLYLLGKKTNEYDLTPPAVPDLRTVSE